MSAVRGSPAIVTVLLRGLNPGAATSSVYSPAARSVKAYVPAVSVAVCFLVDVFAAVTLTTACTTTAPVGSLMVPEREAGACADAAAPKIAVNAGRSRREKEFRFRRTHRRTLSIDTNAHSFRRDMCTSKV